MLRERLRALLALPEVRESIFVASPSLEASLPSWLADPESERGLRIERALVRYVSRMASRPTPFGLFAGIGLGAIGGGTSLALGASQTRRRHTRLDNDYLFALVQKLTSDPAVRDALRFRPNDSLWYGAGRGRYVEARVDGKQRSYHLVVVEDSPELRVAVDAAAAGATRRALADALVKDGTEPDEALAFVDELIASQLVVPELQLAVTDVEPLPAVARELAAIPATRPAGAALAAVAVALDRLDTAGPGADPERYRGIAGSLATLPVEAELDRLFQVDLVHADCRAVLGHALVHEIERAVTLLHRIGQGVSRDPLAALREAFVSRYEGRAVPLLEALDEEVGLGSLLGSGSDPSPLLRGLPLVGAADTRVEWDARYEHLSMLVGRALREGQTEIALEADDVTRLTVANPPPLPDAFEALVTILAPSVDGIARGDYRIHLRGVGGPPAGSLLGRFCHADPGLARALTSLLEHEARADPDAVFAEIVHLPEGRLGNILLRPRLRAFEIPYLGRSGAPVEQQIPVRDLRLSVEDGTFVLRSERLGRRVVPRLTTAHNFGSGLGVYRFLCLLQGQSVSSAMQWDWGTLAALPFLPAVRMGRLVLAPSRWQISAHDVKALGDGVETFRQIQEWRRRYRLPRWVAVTEGDSWLPVDLDNVLSVEAFAQLIKPDRPLTLEEARLAPEDLCLEGPDGRYTHELVVPFVRAKASSDASRPQVLRPARPIARRLMPGSEWLYAKLYTSPELADTVLVEAVGPVTRRLRQAGVVRNWFFIRYGDPDWHVRWRLHGDAGALARRALPAIQDVAARLQARGLIWRFQLDTYEREVERYGGPQGLRLSERVFEADSDAVLEILEVLEHDDAGLDDRWRLALRGMSDLLSDLGFDLQARRAWVTESLHRYAKLVGPGGAQHAWASERYRTERVALEALLASAPDPTGRLAPGLAALRRRSERIAPLVAKLRALERRGRLAVPLSALAASYLHMHGFRLLRSGQNEHEPILLDFLGRIYQSQLARGARPS